MGKYSIDKNSIGPICLMIFWQVVMININNNSTRK
jgi:hypothetical protein